MSSDARLQCILDLNIHDCCSGTCRFRSTSLRLWSRCTSFPNATVCRVLVKDVTWLRAGVFMHSIARQNKWICLIRLTTCVRH